MSKNHLRFLTLGVTAFAGINKNKKFKVEYPEGFDISKELESANPENGLVIVFPDGYNYVKLEGDQGVGKTSLIKCLQEATGGLALPSAVNQEENDKRYSDRFWGQDGFLYHLKVTKSTITLERIDTEEDGTPKKNAKGKEISSIVKEPKSVLQKIVGPAGISPMELAVMKPADQVKWVRSLMTVSTDVEAEENNLKKQIKEAYDSRTVANRERDKHKTLLEQNEVYKNQEYWAKYFDETDYESLQKEVAVVQENYRKYCTGQELLPQLNAQRGTIQESINDLEEQIKQLQVKLDAKREEHNMITDRITKGEEFLKNNESYKTEYEALSEKIEEAAHYPLRKKNYEDMLELQKLSDHYSEESIRLTSRYDKLLETKKSFVKQFSPDIPDFEICIPDEENSKEGIYYKGKPLTLLAESELWEVATQLWTAFGVKIVYVENISSLGSGSIKKFNEFLQKGGYIFATSMNRGEDNLKISFSNRID